MISKHLREIFPAIFLLFTSVSYSQKIPIGEGIVKPPIKAGAVLYLYSGELIDDLLHHKTTKDSLTFVQGQYSIDIGTAPSWFAPELVKLDYDLFYLRAVTISRNWIEVIVNNKTGRTAWIDRHIVEFVPWPEFFLEVFSVELINPSSNPVRLQPLENASIVINPGRSSLMPVAVKGDWMKVSLSQDAPGAIPKLGWIRWKKNDQLLISWSPLS